MKKLICKTGVVLKHLPQGFLDDLPAEDQRAIRAAVGSTVMLNQYDADGRAELEFRDENDVIRFIYVDPRFIESC
ncbi:MAG TPA: hypothetical protein VF133_17030 [Terriglobales bacterium]